MSTPPFLTLPPGVRRTSVQTSRGTFAALEALPGSGVVERGPALLVPGFTGSKEDFIAVLQTLAASGRRVLAIDQRGQHESPGSPDDPSVYARPELGADVAAIAETLGPEPVHLVGHSFGGLIVREAVLADAVLPASLTLMSSGPAGLVGPSARRAAALRDAIPELGMEQIWTLAIEPEAVERGVPADIIAFLRKRTLSNCPTGLRAMADGLITAPDRVEELAKRSRDDGFGVLVLYGEDDDVWHPRTQAEMAEQLDATRVVIPSAAHSPAVDAPETTAAALTTFWNTAERRLR
ncbi:alpha/beta fold hydrolase [Actinomadura rayongensis]|uniref:Alpha/beta fold hydrolase n=1 Tax=Actinomadura rayongensis TaxID=1429076 RepID=A0A6I4W1B8_9ACTN|nr:alpha/beta fold hydrolase [Actinomadura rayongensis]